MTLYEQLSTESSIPVSSSFLPPFLKDAVILLKKQRNKSTAPIRLVIAVVANGDTLFGIHANIMTSVDHRRVTHTRQRLACSLFIVLSLPFSSGV